MVADQRLSTLRRRMVDDGLVAFLATDASNIRYLTGFDGVFDDEANVALLVTKDVARVYTDFRYEEAAREACEATPWALHLQRESLYVEMAEELAEEGIGELAMESSVPYGRFRFVSEKFGGNVTVVDQWIEGIRRVKENAELERMAAAAAITDEAMAHAIGHLALGRTEREIALEIEMHMRTNGAEDVAFKPIVASGPNSSRPHAMTTDRPLQAGDLVTLDMGARVDGYCADLTRTVCMGPADSRQREVYHAVLGANEAAIDGIKSGLRGADVDGIARDALREVGLAEHFGHGLGHGVGLEVHELPNLSPRGRDAVPAGAVVTIEPGVYIPGFGGVRIEDLAVVEDRGCRLLSHATKEFTEIDI
jgi:Xaa-Pro aminopeptidase